ncbi:hypothetical protein BHE74_00049152, partial [Ensete ventricosum]
RRHFCCYPISPPSSVVASAAAPSPLLLLSASATSVAAPSPSASRRPTHNRNHRWALVTLTPQPPSSPSVASSSAGHRSSSPLLHHRQPSLPSPTTAAVTLLQQPSPLPSLSPLLPLPRPIRDLRLQPAAPSRAASISRRVVYPQLQPTAVILRQPPSPFSLLNDSRLHPRSLLYSRTAPFFPPCSCHRPAPPQPLTPLLSVATTGRTPLLSRCRNHRPDPAALPLSQPSPDYRCPLPSFAASRSLHSPFFPC